MPAGRKKPRTYFPGPTIAVPAPSTIPAARLPDNIPTAAGVDRDLMADVLVRSAPHTFAVWASQGTPNPWESTRHLEYIGRKIALGVRKGGMRLIVNFPARHGKSFLISKWTPIWFLEIYPEQNLIMCAYGAGGAQDWGRVVRDEFRTNPLLTTRLREDVQSVTKWHTQKGGFMLSEGIGGRIMGKGYHLGIIDDPYKDIAEAMSPVVRKGMEEWYDHVFYTRREPNASIVILMHRLHHLDLCAYLPKAYTAEPWEVVKLPAIAVPGDPLGRKVGEALWPERWPVESMKGILPHVFKAMYQQDPESSTADRVYYNYDYTRNRDNTPEMEMRLDLPLDLCFDFNRNPGMHVEVGQYDTRDDTMRFRHEIHGHRIGTPEAMELLKKLVDETYGGFKWPNAFVYGDRSGRTQGTVTADTDYHYIMRKLKEWDWPFVMRVPMANPPVKFRVMTINDALLGADGKAHLKVHPDCVRLIADFEEQVTDPVDGNPDKTNQELGHAGDAVGYDLIIVRPIQEYVFAPQRVSV